MKTWSKKVMTLACATCLTVGMAAVACADTIDLGYGQYATTNNGVHAVAVDAIPTNPTFRTMEQNKTLQTANERAAKSMNDRIKTSYPMVKEEFKGTALDGYSLYQLSGDSTLGHHTGWLLTYNVNKEAINYLDRTATQIVNVAMADKQVKAQSVSEPYTKSNAEKFISKMATVTLDRKMLEPQIANLNATMHRDMIKTIQQNAMQDASLSQKNKQSVQEGVDLFKRVIPNFTIVRGSLKYDGFVLPGSLTMYAMPQNDGLTVQILATEDTSRDYWSGQLESMYGLKTLKGGNK
ncbi:MAG: glutamyl-tRNA amidotransferase [Veillonella sp.]|nr:glutamyl-tRNA amidotransferase [Veillonella sp.]